MHGGAPSALVRARAASGTIPGPAAFVAAVHGRVVAAGAARAAAGDARAHDPARARRCSGSKPRCSTTTIARSRARPRCGCARDDVDTRARSRPTVEPPPPPAAGALAAVRVRRPRPTSATGARNDVRLVRGNWVEPGPGDRVVPAALPGRRRRTAVAVRTRRRGRRLRQRRRQPARGSRTRSAINADVTIHVHRHPVGEWVCLESGAWAAAARRRPGRDAAATTSTARSAARVQTLLVESIERADVRPTSRADERRAYSVVVAVAVDVGREQLELAVAEHEHRGPAGERRPQIAAAACRRAPRSCAGRDAVSIVTRSEVSHLNADGGMRERLERRELRLLARAALQRRAPPGR